MLDRERQRLILKWIEERSVVAISDLVNMLDASEATIRRDITAMAERGEIKRVRGGAEAVHPRHQPHLAGRPFDISLGIRAAQKRAIARAAASLIAPGDSIIIGGGTTVFAMAEWLEGAELDILTNSFPVAARLLAASRNRIVLPGGQVYREHSIVLSPFEDAAVDRYWARMIFVGCFGLNRFGIMETDPLIVQSECRLLARAERVVVLADSSKLRNRSSMIVAGLDKVGTLVTDEAADPEALDIIKSEGVEVIVVPVPDGEAEEAV